MKKILLINNGYPSTTHPNYVTYIQSIKECLQQAGFHVDLLVLNSNFNSFIGKYIQFFKYYKNIFLFNQYADYDFVYINNYPYSFLPLTPHFRRIKRVIIHWHGDDIFPGSLFSSILNFFSYKFLGKDFIHIAPSKYFAREAAKRLGIDAENIFVSPSGGVDTSLFSIERKTVNPKLVRLGFASGLLRAKGMELVFSLLKQSSELELKLNAKIEFHYIDYGKEKAHFNDLLHQIPNSVKHNPYPIERMIDFYKNVDILLFPSLRKAESLGLVSIEAMSCGIPVIATDAFAFRDTVISGVTGERFIINDSLDFMNALEKCISRKDQYSTREFVIEHFSKESVIIGYKELLN